MNSDSRTGNNRRLLWILVGLVVGMFAFGFALVPLYDLFCKVTGTQSVGLRQSSGAEPRSTLADAAVVAAAEVRTVTVKLDSSVHPALPWRFVLQQPAVMEVQVGEAYEVVFVADNRSNEAVTAQAIPSVTPWQANPYFNKLECFCFNGQTLAGGQQIRMPLRFVVSPKLPQAINSITLSYNLMKLEAKQS